MYRVYSISYNEYDKIYIGQIRRNIGQQNNISETSKTWRFGNFAVAAYFLF